MNGSTVAEVEHPAPGLAGAGPDTFEYIVVMADGREHRFMVSLARRESPDTRARRLPLWTGLESNRCTNCPLDPAVHATCPPAADAWEVFEAFRDTISHGSCRVIVRTPARDYVKDCDVQTMLRSLLGLIMATSGCPILSRLRGMAETHLPFATMRETVYRTTANYLLEQYFIRKRGGTPDLDLEGLGRLYADLQEVNRCFTVRVRAAALRDANLNAMANLFSVAALVSYSLDDGLAELEGLFSG